MKRGGAVAYRPPVLLPNLSFIHPEFHISMLRKYFPDPSHVLEVQLVKLRDDMSCEVQSVEIVDWQVRKLRSKDIASMKVVWSDHPREETMWELEEHMRNKYLYLFDLDGKTSFLKV